LTAWKTARRVYDVGPIHFLPDAVNLLHEPTVTALAEVVAELGCVAVFVDTLARSMPGGDENAARDVGMALAAADVIRRSCGPAVVLVHHDTKAGGTPRGSSALLGAADTVIETRADGALVRLKCQKMKDAEPFADIRLERVVVGESCVLSDEPSNGLDGRSSKAALLDALDSPIGRQGMSRAELQATTGLPRSTVHYGLNDLVTRGLVSVTGSKARPLYVLASEPDDA
jgi:hypothetical protein